MKIYDAKEFQTLLDSMTKRTTEIGDPLLNLEQAVQKIVSLDSFTGNGPEALKSFYQNSHLPLLRYWQMVNEKRTNLISSLKNTASNFDSHPDAYVNEAFIENEIIPSIDKAKQRTADSADRINAIADSISDIISLPAFDDSQIQEKLHDARQHAQRTVEKLHAFDHQATSTVTQYAELMNPIKTYVSSLEGAINSTNINSATDLTAITLNTEMPDEIMEMHHNPDQMRTVLTMYSELKAQAPQIALSMAMNPIGAVQWFNPYAYGLAQRMFLASGNIDVVNHYSPDQQVKGMSVDADGNVVESIVNQEEAEIINDWGNGHVEIRGAPVDYDALEEEGIITQRFVTNSGMVIHHTDIDGELVIFMDDSDIHYYTNGSVQTFSNKTAARLAQFGGLLLGMSLGHTYLTRNVPQGTVLMKEVAPPTVGGTAKKAALGTSGLSSGVPIVTTPVPDVGTEERILWLSVDEGETWDTKVYVEVDQNGKATMTDYEDRKPGGFFGWILDRFSGE